MTQLDLLPIWLKDQSLSEKEIVLPLPAALDAIEIIESGGFHVLGWEGWVRDAKGHVGHGGAPQGTVSLCNISAQEAAQYCRTTIASEAAQWAKDNQGTTDALYFCITVQL